MSGSLTLVCQDCGSTNRMPAERAAAGPKCGTCGAKLNDGRVREIDLATLAKASKTDGLPIVVDFWASWCGPCRMMAPEFARAAAALGPSARFFKLDTEAHPKAGARYGIRGIPLLILFSGGREAGRLTGARPAAEIEAFVRRHARLPA